MKFIGNLIWVVFGGIFIALEYLIASLLMMITIVGIPFGVQTLKFAALALWPFGTEVKDKSSASSLLNIIMNIVWILLGGFWISITHLVFAFIFAITIIGIPFAQQHIKLAGLSLFPFGKTLV
jgi:uncharacterized membrane protein YccF (DUF307 family)